MAASFDFVFLLIDKQVWPQRETTLWVMSRITPYSRFTCGSDCLLLEADTWKDPQDSGLLPFLKFKMGTCGLHPVSVESASPSLSQSMHRPADADSDGRLALFIHSNPSIYLSHSTVWSSRKRRGVGVRFASWFCLFLVTLENFTILSFPCSTYKIGMLFHFFQDFFLE